MQKTSYFRNLLTCILCVLLIAAMAMTFIGCNGNKTSETDTQVGTEEGTQAVTEIGEGATEFILSVTDGNGNTTLFRVHTDKTTVGEALQALKLIDGEEGAYGLYIKTVNGITADYNVNQTYWAFYVNGQMSMTGADATEITAGTEYAFKVEK